MFTEQQFSIPELQGISQKTIEEHLKLYAGYVKHANLIMSHIAELSADVEKNVYEINELQRRFSFEWGGMRNHEVYFSLLEGGPSTDAPTLMAAIESEWGSFDAFLARFKQIAMTRGIGWAMLSFDPKTKQLVLGWVDEQHLGQLVDTRLIVGLDMWEHSYVADYYPSGKKQYVEDFFANINWSVAEKYFTEAQK